MRQHKPLDRRNKTGKRHYNAGPAKHKRRIEKETKTSKALARETLGLSKADILESDLSIEENESLTIPQRMLLAAYSETGSIFVSSKLAGIGKTTHDKWLRDSQDYQEAFELARLQAIDKLEQEARRRGAEGIKRFKFYKGKPIRNPETGEPYFELEYSDNLLMCLLKAYAPERFKDRVEQHVSGSVDSQVSVRAILAQVPLDLRKQLLSHLQAKKDGKAQAQLPAPDPDDPDDSEDEESDEEE